MAFHSFQKIHYLSSTFYGQKQGIEDFSLEAEKVPGKSSVGDLGFKLFHCHCFGSAGKQTS